MIVREAEASWKKGRSDARRGAKSNCPDDVDRLAYASGYIEGDAERKAQQKAERAKRSRFRIVAKQPKPRT